MDFYGIEGLTAEDINTLYEDVWQQDTAQNRLAECQGYCEMRASCWALTCIYYFVNGWNNGHSCWHYTTRSTHHRECWRSFNQWWNEETRRYHASSLEWDVSRACCR